MKRLLSSPAVPVLLGLGLGCLRAAERLAAYEPDTGLMTPGHPLVWIFWLLTALYALAALLCHRPFGEKPQLCDLRLQAPGSGTALGMTLGAFLVLLGSVVMFYQFAAAGQPEAAHYFSLVLGLLGVAAAGGMLWCAAAAGRRVSLLERQMSMVLPVFWASGWGIRCLWLYSVDPVPDDYLPDLLAILLLMLGLAYLAGFAFHDGYPRRVRVFLRLGTALILTATVGAFLYHWACGGAAAALPALADRLGLLGGGVYLAACDWAIARTPEQGPVPAVPPPEEDEEAPL